MKNLPMDLLRTFVAIKDLGGFTQAGEMLGRSQPAISLQIKRLEELVNVQLLIRSGGMKMTEEGQMFYNYARQILDLNDTAVTRLAVPAVSGSVRLGLPNDFEVSFLPTTLSKFSQTYPDVTLDVQTDLSVNLRQDFKAGAYDLVMLMDEYPDHSFREDDFIAEPLTWISGPGFTPQSDQPVPLVLYPKGCIYRQHITNALNKANIPWRVLYSTSSLLGIQAAIDAGLGLSALALNTAPAALTSNDLHQRLPALGKVTIGFHYDHATLPPAAARLLEYLRRGLQRTRGAALRFDHLPPAT
ncbi:LysR substrate-binding domain-containing protein [Marinobacter sp. X15-166B]|uniref:LysR substrate-binding domain-containing protein n=1 Tax=Marinobacter sp. X15-166B TaxID=1897620 RepID=UPI00085C4316|nr:LysR substrate-binding domain-containing protein [Marinobacter sp. X15-166B]OEY65441.1 LysR family transcriptional regulator [Marinobacter sp. X15-166B]